MSKTADLLETFNESDAAERIALYGVNPKEEDVKKILAKLYKFGQLGVKGFDLAARAYEILRGIQDHEDLVVPRYDEEGVLTSKDTYQRPFYFLVDSSQQENDRGKFEGFKYGLRVLRRSLPEVDFVNHEANSEITVIANGISTARTMIAQRLTEDTITSTPLVTGVGPVMPANASEAHFYVVLSKHDASDLIEGPLFPQHELTSLASQA